VIGANPNAGRTAGMDARRATVLVLTISGALVGLAGMSTLAGTDFFLSSGYGGNVGFDAITVALLGLATPGGIVLAALLFGALEAGGQQLNGIAPQELPQVMEAVIVLFIAAPQLVRIIFRLRATSGGGGQLAKGWNG
jgi:general nucleoside transport system permease protein